MFDVLAFPEPYACPEAVLRAPIAAGPNDTIHVLQTGRTRHLGRWRPCCWQLVVHRAASGACWTHLYRVLPEHGGRVLVLLEHAVAGDASQQGWALPRPAKGQSPF